MGIGGSTNYGSGSGISGGGNTYVDDTFGTGNIYTNPVLGGVGGYDGGTSGIGYGVGEIDPGLADAIPDNSDYVTDSSAGTVTYDPITSGGTGTTGIGTDDDVLDFDFDPISTDPLDPFGGSGASIGDDIDTGGIDLDPFGGSGDVIDLDPYVPPVYYDGFGNSYGTEDEATSADASAAEESILAEEVRLAEEARIAEEARVEAERERAIQIALQPDPYESVTVNDPNIYDTDVVPYEPDPVVSGGTGTTGIGPYDDVSDFDFGSVSDVVDDSDPLEAFGGSGDPIDDMLVDLGINLESGANTTPSVITDLAIGSDDSSFPTGPFVDPEQTALEDIADLNYLDETNPNVAPDFTEGLTDFDLSEIESLADGYYDTGAGSDGYTFDDEIASSMDAFDTASDDMNALDMIADESSDIGSATDITTYSVGDSISADLADILGMDVEGQILTPALANQLDGIIDRLGYTDVAVSFGDNSDGSDDISTISDVAGPVSLSPTDLYLSAMDKISDPNYDPNNSTLTEAEQRALSGSRGQTPNAAETAYLSSLLGGAKHAEDGPIGADGEPIYRAGDDVTPATFGETATNFGIGLVDSIYNPFSLLGGNFTIGGIIEGINDASIEEQLEAYKNGGTFIYGEDGATVVGVAAPNYDASGDGSNDTVVLYDGNGEISVTGDGIAVEDIIESNNNSDGEEFDIDIVDSDMTYTNTEDGVVTTSTGSGGGNSGGGSGGGSGDSDLVDPEICEEGFEFDPVEGICMPIDVTVALPDRPTTAPDPVVTTPVAPRPTTGGLTVRTPGFNRGGVVTRNIDKFANGGVVTKNIDNFLGGMR
tara:strand:- start:1748 stop:4219 length:2472 start_codon:yes stop_codon:yes gene_type:complete